MADIFRVAMFLEINNLSLNKSNCFPCTFYRERFRKLCFISLTFIDIYFYAIIEDFYPAMTPYFSNIPDAQERK